MNDFDRALTAICNYWECASEDQIFAESHLAGTGAVAELEIKLKKHYGKQYALCVSNATMGLLAIALALDLKGVEFITTPFTYGASLSGFLLQENRPIFANLTPQTLTLDPDSVRSQITPNTRAILAVDILGNPCDMGALRQIADDYGLWYIADAAQSLGAYTQGMPASAFADALVVSFTVGKSVFAGEGGAILTDNEQLYQKLVWLTQHPYRQKRDVGLFLTNEFALNGRIHPLAAVIANATFEASLQQLRQYQEWCFQVIEVLNESGFTEVISWQTEQILPSFFRFCGRWRGESAEEELLQVLGDRNFNLKLQPFPIQLIPKKPAFIAQYGHLLSQEEALKIEGKNGYFCLQK
ncbi:MAG: DegT/DnrJ/EryC1/StrS family aminotransferase [Chroococcales cyanobacterium]